MTEPQRNRLWELCGAYGVPFRETDYCVVGPGSPVGPGWVEGWVGGQPGTLYVGVSPEGQAHS